jgi:hypothetical protein
VVVSVSMLGAGSDPAGYYLSRQANCPADYYLGAEPAGRWLGAGAAAAGLSGWVDTAGAKTLRDLLAGKPPGEQGMPAPTMVRADPRGRLPAAPLVDAIRDRGEAQAVPVEDLFPDPVDRAHFAGLQTRTDRPRRPAADGVSGPGPAAGHSGRDRRAEGVPGGGRHRPLRRCN